MVRIVACIPTHHKDNKSKVDEIERKIIESDAEILVLPEEYFGGPTGTGRFETFSTDSRLFYSLSNLASAHSCGLVVGAIEGDKSRKYQALWFFNEKGKHVGTERKHNLARYEVFHYQLTRADSFDRDAHLIKGTKGTGIFCWEIHDIRSRVSCDTAEPDWIANVIKFPLNCLTKYDSTKSQMVLKEIARSEKVYLDWVEKLKNLACDLITIVVVSSGTSFSLRSMPKGAKPLACIVHPNDKVLNTLFHFDPKNQVEESRKKSRIRRGLFGTIALTNEPGSFVGYDLHDDIKLLHMGPKQYEAKFGYGSFPQHIVVTARAWQLRHLGRVQDYFT